MNAITLSRKKAEYSIEIDVRFKKYSDVSPRHLHEPFAKRGVGKNGPASTPVHSVRWLQRPISAYIEKKEKDQV